NNNSMAGITVMRKDLQGGLAANFRSVCATIIAIWSKHFMFETSACPWRSEATPLVYRTSTRLILTWQFWQ
ncbi:MAG: hypothetical protein RR405_06330, partial [Clostridia bacterium]